MKANSQTFPFAVALVVLLAGVHAIPSAKTHAYLTQSIWPVDVRAIQFAEEPKPITAVHTEAEHTHTHDNYRSVGKPGSAVASVVGSARFTFSPQETQTLQLQLQSPLKEGLLTVNLDHDPGLAVADMPRSWQFDLNEPSPITLPVTVTANDNGQQYLHLVIHHQVDGHVIESRALAVEIQVGEDSVAKTYSKNYKVRPSYPEVIPMQAQERIY